MIIPFGPFEPDRTRYSDSVSMVANNVVPTSDGWGPLPDITTISQALPAPCKGACYVRTSSGTTRIIAGTATKLYQLNTTDYSWTDITRTVGGNYSLGTDDYWTFTRFGDLLICHNLQDVIQKYNIESGGNVSALGGTPPKAKYSWVAGDFLVLGYLDGTPSGARSVWWSGVNNAEQWTLGKEGSDTQELPEGDEVVGGFGEQGGFQVIQRAGMQFFPFALDSGFTFTRQVLNPKQGSVAPRSIVSLGPGMFFYLSEDGFFGGSERRPIGSQRVDKWLMDQAADNLAAVQGAADPFRKIIWWRYKLATGEYRRIGYHWQLDRWLTSDANIGEMVALATPSITWDGLATLYATIDDITEPFDSRLFLGGRPTMAAFGPDNKLGYFAGGNMAATLETGDLALDQTNRTMVTGVRALTDAATVAIQVGSCAQYADAPVFTASQTPHPRSGMCNFRSDGRLHRFRQIIPSDVDWSTVQGLNVSAEVTGGI